jgi:hypothetical protein
VAVVWLVVVAVVVSCGGSTTDATGNWCYRGSTTHFFPYGFANDPIVLAKEADFWPIFKVNR